MPDITGRALSRIEIAVVLRNGCLKHGRTKIRGVGETLGKRVVGQERKSMGVTPAHVDVAGVVPALCRVLQQIDGAYRERQTDGIHLGRQNSSGDKADLRERTARANRARSGRRVVDKMCALQMKTVVAQEAYFESRLAAQALFHRGAPLLQVLSRRVQIHRREA